MSREKYIFFIKAKNRRSDGFLLPLLGRCFGLRRDGQIGEIEVVFLV